MGSEWERVMWAGKGWGLMVNCIYIGGKCELLFVNGNVIGIYFRWIDLDLGGGKVCGEVGVGVGIC